MEEITRVQFAELDRKIRVNALSPGPTVRTHRHEFNMFSVHDLESSDAAANVHADTFGVPGSYGQRCLTHCEVCGSEGELNKAAGLLDVLAVDEIFRNKAFDLACECRRIISGVKE